MSGWDTVRRSTVRNEFWNEKPIVPVIEMSLSCYLFADTP